MIGGWRFVLVVVAALGCGLMAGAFYAFSSFVMKALAHLPSTEGIAAMQSINVEAVKPWFMAGFLGTAAACVAVIAVSLFEWGEPFAAYLLVGGLLYLVGTFLLTIVYHVPRNDALAAVAPDSPDAAGHWTRYTARWTAGNHVRALAALAAAALLTIAVHVD